MENTKYTTREQVEEYFRRDRSYEGAQRLYLGLQYYNRALAREFNRPHTPERLDLLRYYLAKGVGIPEGQWRGMLAEPQAEAEPPAPVQEASAPAEPQKESPLELLEKSREVIGEEAYQQARERILEAEARENSRQLQEAFSADTAAARGRQLVDDFPFLMQDTTPAEIKALAHDKVDAWMRLQVARADLFKAVTPQECYQAAKTAAESLALNQDIWDELIAYRDTGHPLYRLPELQMLKFKDEQKGKNAVELVKALNNARSAKSKAKTPEKKEEWAEKAKYLEGLVEAIQTK